MYEEMTYEKVLKSMFERIPESMDQRESSIVYASLAATAYILADTYFGLDNYLNLIFPDTSAGEFLDRFALAFNITRKAATKAVRIGVFDKQIPIGSRFSSAGESSLVFTATGLIETDGTSAIYYLECETAGKEGNEYFGNLIPVEYISGLTSAVLTEVKVPGTDEETDELLRDRLLAKIRRPSTSGNANDYYNWTMSCDGVGAAKIFPLADGPGTVKIVIADEDKKAADAPIIAQVLGHINTMRPIGAAISVVSAVEKTVNISATVKLSGANLGNVQNTFRAAVEEYLQINAFDVTYISLARVGNILMETAGVDDYTDLKLNGMAGNISLKDEEIAVIGTVRLEVM